MAVGVAIRQERAKDTASEQRIENARKSVVQGSRRWGIPATEAVRRMVPTLRRTLERRDIEELAWTGLARLVQNDLDIERDVVATTAVRYIETDTEERQTEPYKVRVVLIKVLEQTEYVGADGRQKPLSKFTRADVVFVGNRDRLQGLALLKNADWMAEAHRLMELRGVSTVGGLPFSDQESLARLWIE